MKNKPALTLVELIVVLGLIMLVSGVGFLNLINIKGKYAVKTSAEKMALVLKQAHISAREGKAVQRWGIKCSSVTDYGLYSSNADGTNPSPILISYKTENLTKMAAPCPDIWFNMRTGDTSTPTSITIWNNNNTVSRTINISAQGVISVN